MYYPRLRNGRRMSELCLFQKLDLLSEYLVIWLAIAPTETKRPRFKGVQHIRAVLPLSRGRSSPAIHSRYRSHRNETTQLQDLRSWLGLILIRRNMDCSLFSPLVEPGGVEPPSKRESHVLSTCLSSYWVFVLCLVRGYRA